MTENQTKEMFNLLTKCVSGIQELTQDVSVLKQDMSEVKNDVAVLKQDMSEVKQDVAVLKQDVAVLKEDVAVLKEDVSELKEGQKRIEREMRLNTAAVNQIAGEQVRMNVRISELEKASV